MKNPCKEIIMPDNQSLVKYKIDWNMGEQVIQNEKAAKKRSLIKIAVKALEPELDLVIERIIKDSDLDEQLDHIKGLMHKLSITVKETSEKIKQTAEFTKRQEQQNKLDELQCGYVWGETTTKDYLKDKFSKYEQTFILRGL